MNATYYNSFCFIQGWVATPPEMRTDRKGRTYLYFRLAWSSSYGSLRKSYIDCYWLTPEAYVVHRIKKGDRVSVLGRLDTWRPEGTDVIRYGIWSLRIAWYGPIWRRDNVAPKKIEQGSLDIPDLDMLDSIEEEEEEPDEG